MKLGCLFISYMEYHEQISNNAPPHCKAVFVLSKAECEELTMGVHHYQDSNSGLYY